MKNIVIIGATSGISQSVTKKMLADDVCMHLVARDERKLNIVASDIASRGCGEVHCYQLDFNMLSQHASVVQDIIDKAGVIDTLFVCYGIMHSQSDCEADVTKAVEQVTSNYTSVVSLLVLFSQVMQKQNTGTIAVVSSVAGDRGRKSNYIYGSAKAGLTTFLEGLRYKLYEKGIHVLTIKPGFVDSPMTAHLKKGILWVSTEVVAEHIMNAINKKKSVAYVPPFWFLIMLIIKNIPAFIFRKLNF